jgi:hypothetical protein
MVFTWISRSPMLIPAGRRSPRFRSKCSKQSGTARTPKTTLAKRVGPTLDFHRCAPHLMDRQLFTPAPRSAKE